MILKPVRPFVKPGAVYGQQRTAQCGLNIPCMASSDVPNILLKTDVVSLLKRQCHFTMIAMPALTGVLALRAERTTVS